MLRNTKWLRFSVTETQLFRIPLWGSTWLLSFAALQSMHSSWISYLPIQWTMYFLGLLLPPPLHCASELTVMRVPTAGKTMLAAGRKFSRESVPVNHFN